MITTMLLVVELVLAIGLIALVAVQQAKGEGLGAFGGSSQSFFAKNKGLEALLDKITVWVLAAFMVITALFVFV